MQISRESQEFLKNLRVYLLSSGKNEQEINDIVEELEDHLHEAEKNGKDVDEIIGQSPKEYMNQLADEMPLDLTSVLKYIPIIILGGFSFILMEDAIRGNLEYSLLEIIGYPSGLLINLFLIGAAFKYLASTKLSATKQWLILSIVGMVPTALFVGIYYLDRFIETPAFQLGTFGVASAVVVSISVFIGIAVWSKSWVTIIIPLLLFLPKVLIDMTSIEGDTKLIVNSILPFLLVGLYLLIVSKKEQQI
ncbi:hypothetical protein IMZ31_02085 [Pontibacillus sp. ALD_SL1]|uniref:HAAS domain-containing protein n=1 Tax=Pontibacillus sp. ALD_SL1 TaxID=2777185 RepID=UPI001A956F93|nr:hypothetical protein [Pontibacillus sp. ALD_SL1]QST00407.1 hypothetical protein IMZ31_02085 [Pontibacillus sp. ALD_SL1]